MEDIEKLNELLITREKIVEGIEKKIIENKETIRKGKEAEQLLAVNQQALDRAKAERDLVLKRMENA